MTSRAILHGQPLRLSWSDADPRAGEIHGIDVAIPLAAHPGGDGIDHCRPVFGRIDMDAERALAAYSAARASSAGLPEWAKWLVPLIKVPGTIIVVSRPHGASSVEQDTASASIAALAAK